MKLKKLIWNWKVLLLIIFLIFALLAINPKPFAKGLLITKVDANSAAAQEGISAGEIIIEINTKEINSLGDYQEVLSQIQNNTKVTIKTDKDTYIFLYKDTLGLDIKEVEKSNIKKGLDLAGGTRVLLTPAIENPTDEQINNLISILKQRLDVYGISDLTIRSANDLSGNKFVLVEISGVTQQEVKDLIAQQGRFEANIGNETVFKGEEKDIRRVCKDDASCSGVRQCLPFNNGYNCRFEFVITLSKEAAKRHADITRNLGTNITQGQYLEKPLDLYLDNVLVDSLQIGTDLKGAETTDILISGPGVGLTEEEAIKDAVQNMNKLQTILIVGSLPFDLEIVKLDTISPILGEAFLKNIFLVAFVALLAVGLVIFIRYRSLKISIPIVITMLSEIFIVIGIAALIRWRLDVASIAGIIASVGTGVDDQIVIVDELLSKETYSQKEKFKRAFFIIIAAFVTTVAAMLPLWNAGAGLIRGFALTTILGVTIGILITRPAYAVILGNLLEENE